MKFITNEQEEHSLLLKERKIFTITDVKGNLNTDSLFNGFFKKNKFQSNYFMEFNNCFDSQLSYKQLIHFLMAMHENTFYIDPISCFEGQGLIKAVECKVSDSFEDYQKHLYSTFKIVHEKLILDFDSAVGIPNLSDFILMFGENENWAMVHDNFNSLIVIGVKDCYKKEFIREFEGEYFGLSQAIILIETINQGQVLAVFKKKLFDIFGTS